MASRVRRIAKEIEDCQKADTSNLSVHTIGDDLSHLKGTFHGPTETPYEGGLFTVDIQIPNDYPFRPPKMKFDTKIYHPNISSQTGAICLDILKEQWSPVLTIKSALVSLQSMLNDPQPNDPQDAEVASHYLKDRASFDKTARYWTQQYASGGAASEAGGGVQDPIEMYGFDRSFVQQFYDMGFPQERVIEVLRRLQVKKQADCDRLPGGLNHIVEEIVK
ncbi:Ubiquitin-conjugating enzyme E2 1 [Taphrina deformans PYCC 5710]|uniref:Ubiquitin-conjugating enzyme E2 1 n=1 Tax=Taphrina deformans (strain PYCC 5710 / ATCC 11124 / CBS 356.35 / IMI 108563 / JCM 9778 / NBRC 8474) TaxID=1097556 RepID=R4XA43_TAPDE|nr:Ubiquitin-conjugating enzyme E2 1 [Taphrina deformans PYCC 5710]|eukprot:CCG82392.1 Ubiquitin-conjugating enzyme E2 1 [Taphrina deformans PYCC 5710]